MAEDPKFPYFSILVLSRSLLLCVRMTFMSCSVGLGSHPILCGISYIERACLFSTLCFCALFFLFFLFLVLCPFLSPFPCLCFCALFFLHFLSVSVPFYFFAFPLSFWLMRSITFLFFISVLTSFCLPVGVVAYVDSLRDYINFLYIFLSW